MKKLFAFLCCFASLVYGQDELDPPQSNIQTYTPTKLLSPGQWDLKWFNNLYTQTTFINDQGKRGTVARENFFTSSLDIFTGVSASNRLNIGLLLEYRSNTIGGKNILAPFDFSSAPYKRSGLSSIAPAIKFTPFAKWARFAIQSSLSLPLFEKEVAEGIYFDQKGYTLQNRFFYDYLAPNGVIQIYSELNTEFNFGENQASFANDSFRLSPGVFVSYFPSPNVTLQGLAQHSELLDLGSSINQRFTAVGGGAKFQLNHILNLELLYTHFVLGKNSGLGQTFNIGLRALFN
ncbi:MAG: hypothetical protein ACPG8F_07780 [Flavobacteriaceae bacterium]